MILNCADVNFVGLMKGIEVLALAALNGIEWSDRKL